MDVTASAVLALLRARLGGACWLLTRLERGTHVCVAADGAVVPAPGEPVAWEPAPTPVRLPGGRIVGGLGPLGPARPDPELVAAFAAVLGELLGQRDERRRTALADDRPTLVSLDPVTGLPDRRGWGQLLRHEAERARRAPAPLSVVSIVVSDATPPLAMLAAHTVRATCRSVDVVARTGPAEFAVLGVTPGDDPQVLLDRLAVALREEDVPATLGFARNRPGHSLEATFDEARAAARAVEAPV